MPAAASSAPPPWQAPLVPPGWSHPAADTQPAVPVFWVSSPVAASRSWTAEAREAYEATQPRLAALAAAGAGLRDAARRVGLLRQRAGRRVAVEDRDGVAGVARGDVGALAVGADGDAARCVERLPVLAGAGRASLRDAARRA